MIYNRKNSSKAFKIKFLALLSSMLFANYQLFAQSDSSNIASTDTEINKTTKTVFQQASKSVGSKDTLVGIIMIVLVLAVVVIALYLSFKSSNGSLKRKKVTERQQKRGHQTN
jgi:cell division protein FtsL